jgi:hypothetical protein
VRFEKLIARGIPTLKDLLEILEDCDNYDFGESAKTNLIREERLYKVEDIKKMFIEVF